MEFASFVITNVGQSLMAKMMQGRGKVDFTAIKLSSQTYTEEQLAGLTSLANIKQTAPITKKTVVNTTAIQIEGAIDNTALTTGYNIQTIGLFATDPDDGEILYAVARATTAGYMPPYNGITVSGGYFKFVVTVGAANQVTVTVDPAGYASIGDVQALQKEVDNLKGYVGLEDDSVFGVEADFANRTFTRLAGAVGRNAGSGFDDLEPWGGRYRCNLTDDGVEVAKYGDPGYSETGKLTQAITLGEDDSAVTYPVGTIVQTMVKQPRFYYKVVPLKMDKISGGKGYHLRKARYFISMSPRPGFKIHPAFMVNGVEQDYIYVSAYEGTLYDVSASAYILDDAQVADFTKTTGDKLCSIANAKPISGLTQNLTRRNCGVLAENRGSGWTQAFAATSAMTQILFLIEYASFNTQAKIGMGNASKTDDGATNMSEVTGATTNLGNASGAVTNGNNINIVTYRGEENFWANIWGWVDGLNIYSNGDNTNNSVYVADHAFVESKNNDHYKDAGFVLPPTNGYVNAFGYSEEFDWLFLPSEVNNGASSSVPVGDYYYQSTASAGWRVATLGGHWSDGAYGGGFHWCVNGAPSYRSRVIGGRLAYVPKQAA
jgi:hypothetical protein